MRDQLINRHMPLQAGEVAMIRTQKRNDRPQAMPGLLGKPFVMAGLCIVSVSLWALIILAIRWVLG